MLLKGEGKLRERHRTPSPNRAAGHLSYKEDPHRVELMSPLFPTEVVRAFSPHDSPGREMLLSP